MIILGQTSTIDQDYAKYKEGALISFTNFDIPEKGIPVVPKTEAIRSKILQLQVQLGRFSHLLDLSTPKQTGNVDKATVDATRVVAAAWRNKTLPLYKNALAALSALNLETEGSPGWMIDMALKHVNAMRDTPEWWQIIGGTIGKEADVLSYGLKKIADAISLPAAAAIAPVSSLPAIKKSSVPATQGEDEPQTSMLPWKWIAMGTIVIGGIAWAGYYFLRRPSPKRAF